MVEEVEEEVEGVVELDGAAAVEGVLLAEDVAGEEREVVEVASARLRNGLETDCRKSRWNQIRQDMEKALTLRSRLDVMIMHD